jgi:hypothetical protein
VAAIGPIPGESPDRGADRLGADAAPLPDEASVLGLLRTGFGDSGQRRVPRDPWPGRSKPVLIRGLNWNHNHDLKNLFKSIATMASVRAGIFREFYLGLLSKGMKPEMARLTLARKIAAITLKIWKEGETFNAEHVKPQAA